MKRSDERILTSHVGTLPRPPALENLDGPVGSEAYFKALPAAVETSVREQHDAGLDVVNDGEFAKIGGYAGYIRSRLTGFEMKPGIPPVTREALEFPNYSLGRTGGTRPADAPPALHPVCTGPIKYVGADDIARDIANLQAAVASVPVSEVFMAAVSPDNVSYQPGANEYYESEERYIAANAAALRKEYEAIVDAGFILQIDMPVRKFNALSLSVEEFRHRFALIVEILNDSLVGIPSDRIRVHVCYGGMKIAHIGDPMLYDYLDILFGLHADCISYDQNVRHDHEWNLFKELPLPEGKILMPGVVAHTTDVIEHPLLVRERIVRLSNLVGKENVIAGTDCGLGGRVHPEIAWAKFRSMAEGARLATEALWSH